MQLNKAQMEAATHREGPLLVLAAPGSGKTSVICNRVRFLIETCGVPPEKICVLTFTKEAAGAMQQRIHQNHPYPVSLGTVHSLCYQILSQYSILQSHTLISSTERKELIRRLLAEQKKEDRHYSVTGEEVELISNELTKDAAYIKTACEPIPGSLYAEYQRKKEELGIMDYDDLLLKTLQLLQTEEKIRLFWQKRFEFYLVDEFQDLNEIQFQILCMLAKNQENLMAVGDDDQSIYGFRGASPDIIRQFQQNFPNCKTVYLSINYRCADRITRLSETCIIQNKSRIEKPIIQAGKENGLVQCRNFSSGQFQAEYIMKELNRLNQELKSERIEDKNLHTAVLFRTGKQMEDFLTALEQLQCDGYSTQLRFLLCVLEDLRHYLNLLLTGDQLQDILVIMNHPDRGLSRMFLPVEDFSLEFWERFCVKCGEDKQAEAIRQLRIQLNTMASFQPNLGLKYFMEVCEYKEYIISKFNKYNTKKYELENALENLLERLKSSSWKEMNNKLNIELSNIKRKTTDEKSFRRAGGWEGVRFMTMHASKGLEFDHVFIPDLNEGWCPSGKSIHQKEIEQERRLFYVAMTRARKTLTLTYLEGENQKKKSRFLSELGF